MTITVFIVKTIVSFVLSKNSTKKSWLEYEEKSLEKDFGSDPSKLIEDIGKMLEQCHKLKLMVN